MLKKINTYSGSLTLLSVVCAIVFHFTNITYGIKQIETATNEQGGKLELIHDSLTDKTRDHLEFSRSSERTNEILSDMTVVLAKLEVTLNALDRKIK